MIATLVVGVPLLVVPTTGDSFGLPKTLASEWLTLASVLALLWWWRRAVGGERQLGASDLRNFARRPVVRAAAPLLLVAAASLFWSSHRGMTREALIGAWIGGAGLVAWSLASESLRLRRLLDLLLVPALLLSIFGVLQAHAIFQPFGLQADLTGRQEATSLAGNVGVFGAYLILPLLLLAERLVEAAAAANLRRLVFDLALALVFLYALLLTQTLTVFVALAAGLTTWLLLRIRGSARAWSLAAIAVAALAFAFLGPRLSDRIATTQRLLLDGQWNAVLTFRGDGWASAVGILRRQPLLGTGHGTFRREFAEARLEWAAEGHPVSEANFNPHFANAHNDYLEVAAELGLVGLAALGYALFVLFGAVRTGGAGRPLAASGVVSIGILAIAYFPFETPLLAYPWLLFLAWVLARGDSRPAESKELEPAERSEPSGATS